MMVLLLLLLVGATSVIADEWDEDDYNDRIIGGVAANIDDFPFIVSISTIFTEGTLRSVKNCGGTIVAASWVLTAAHCFKGECSSTLSHVVLRAGSNNAHSDEVVRYGKKLVKNNYPPEDIALIQVDEVWPLNGKTIAIAALPRQDEVIPSGSPAIIMGWGNTDLLGNSSEILLKQYVMVLSYDECLDYYKTTDISVSEKEMCTFFGPGEAPPHTWHGDSGSPVVSNGEVVGVVSAGFVADGKVFPDIHTRVSSYIDWIEQNVGLQPCAMR